MIRNTHPAQLPVLERGRETEWYAPGDMVICCPCGYRFGRWPVGAGEPPARLELYCTKPRCRRRRRVIFRAPPADKVRHQFPQEVTIGRD